MYDVETYSNGRKITSSDAHRLDAGQTIHAIAANYGFGRDDYQGHATRHQYFNDLDVTIHQWSRDYGYSIVVTTWNPA
jgi:hypothetical protein